MEFDRRLQYLLHKGIPVHKVARLHHQTDFRGRDILFHLSNSYNHQKLLLRRSFCTYLVRRVLGKLNQLRSSVLEDRLCSLLMHQ